MILHHHARTTSIIFRIGPIRRMTQRDLRPRSASFRANTIYVKYFRFHVFRFSIRSIFVDIVRNVRIYVLPLTALFLSSTGRRRHDGYDSKFLYYYWYSCAFTKIPRPGLKTVRVMESHYYYYYFLYSICRFATSADVHCDYACMEGVPYDCRVADG